MGRALRVAIIGSGPAGFYAAGHLLAKDDPEVEVDLYERLPTPWGLVRSGVAPDHPKIKSVTRIYDKTAAHPRLRWFGNIEIGRHVHRDELVARYDAVVYAVGAETDRPLQVPGADLPGVWPATQFVGWYNGHPDHRDHPVRPRGPGRRGHRERQRRRRRGADALPLPRRAAGDRRGRPRARRPARRRDPRRDAARPPRPRSRPPSPRPSCASSASSTRRTSTSTGRPRAGPRVRRLPGRGRHPDRQAQRRAPARAVRPAGPGRQGPRRSTCASCARRSSCAARAAWRRSSSPATSSSCARTGASARAPRGDGDAARRARPELHRIPRAPAGPASRSTSGRGSSPTRTAG
jgi:hypothetical protein